MLPIKLPEFMLNPIGYVRALELRYLELHCLKLRSEEPAKPGFQLVYQIKLDSLNNIDIWSSYRPKTIDFGICAHI